MQIRAYLECSLADEISSFLIKQDIEPSLVVELIQQWVLDSVTTLIKIHDEIPHEDYFNDYVCRELMNEMEHWVLPVKLTNELLTKLIDEFHADIVGHLLTLFRFIFKLLVSSNMDPDTITKISINDLTWGYAQLKIEIVNEDKYFHSEIHRLIFTLLHMDGKSRMDALEVRRIHYCDEKKAKLWYKKLANKVHPDKCTHPKAEEAFAALNELYNRMTYK